VALVQALDQDVPVGKISDNTNPHHWQQGSQVDLAGSVNSQIAIGTPIATFTNLLYDSGHAAMFLGAGVENGAIGFFVLDQYNNPEGNGPLPAGTPLNVNNYEPAEIRFIAITGSAQDVQAVHYFSILNS
jgi:hypothetical protein